MSELIVLIVDDLMFLPKLENTLRNLGYQTIVAPNETVVGKLGYQQGGAVPWIHRAQPFVGAKDKVAQQQNLDTTNPTRSIATSRQTARR